MPQRRRVDLGKPAVRLLQPDAHLQGRIALEHRLERPELVTGTRLDQQHPERLLVHQHFQSPPSIFLVYLLEKFIGLGQRLWMLGALGGMRIGPVGCRGNRAGIESHFPPQP